MMKWDLFLEHMDGSTHKINVIHHINRIRDKNHMIILIDAEKAFDKVQQTFMIIILNKLGIEEIYLDIIKLNMKSPQLISHSVVKIESILLKSRTR